MIGVSLADIILAYSSDDAKRAKESFVLIPTMSEVAAARHILRESGKAADEQSSVGPGSGLVPIFWSESLAVQSAGGKQRKVLANPDLPRHPYPYHPCPSCVTRHPTRTHHPPPQVLFFRLNDLRQMWRTLSESRKEAGEPDELPEGPAVQCSDLQTLAGLLVAANKTDDVMFLPSSAAIRHAQGQVGRARSRAAAGDSASGGDGQAADASWRSEEAEEGLGDEGGGDEDGEGSDLGEAVGFDGDSEDDVVV